MEVPISRYIPIFLKTASAFKEAAECEDLDIYQMCAGVSQQDFPLITKATYYAKAACCWSIQVIGLMLFILVQIEGFVQDSDEICRMNDDKISSQETKVLSVMFAFYIALKTSGSIHDINGSGLYTMNPWTGSDCPPMVTRWWVFLGLYTNVVVTLASILGSFLVLYRSEDMLDAILNSVALFFVNDMDNFMMNKKDYRRIYEWYEAWKESGEIAHPELNALASCMAYYFLTPMSYAIAYGCIGLSCVAPFWMAFCQ